MVIIDAKSMLVVIVFLCALASAYFAQRRGANAFLWFMLGLIFGPLGLMCSFFAGSFKAFIPLGIVLVLAVAGIAVNEYINAANRALDRKDDEERTRRIAWIEARSTASPKHSDVESLKYEAGSVKIIGDNKYRVMLRLKSGTVECIGSTLRMDCS